MDKNKHKEILLAMLDASEEIKYHGCADGCKKDPLLNAVQFNEKCVHHGKILEDYIAARFKK